MKHEGKDDKSRPLTFEAASHYTSALWRAGFSEKEISIMKSVVSIKSVANSLSGEKREILLNHLLTLLSKFQNPNEAARLVVMLDIVKECQMRRAK